MAGSPAMEVDGGVSGSDAGDTPVDNPGLLTPESDSGTGSGGGIKEPTCGASSLTAEQVIVETTIEVPETITETVVEQVPETITEDVVEEVEVEKPVSLYIMFDQSQSMSWSNLWTPAVKALKSFVNDPKSAGTGVALQYFPISGGSCGGTGGAYGTPEVKLGVLPAQASAVSSSLDKHSASGSSTPIEGALRGVTDYCVKFQAAHPDEQCVAVLVTDGEPCSINGCACNDNFDTLAGIAKAAHDKGVTTFAVGLSGANFTLLDKIAKAGGAPDCDDKAAWACDVSGGAEELSLALNSIREKTKKTEIHQVTKTITREVTHEVTHEVVKTVTHQEVQKTSLPCEWTIPTQTNGQLFDRNKVNIQLTNGDEQSTFVRVSSNDACIADGWRYDDANNPQRMIACPQTCDAISGLAEAKIDILLGCATRTPD